MPRPDDLQEPELSPATQRVVAAMSVSIALHLALIGLVRVNPVVAPAATNIPVLQARLQAAPPQPVAAPPPRSMPQVRAPDTPPESAPPSAPVAVAPPPPSVPIPAPVAPQPPAPPAPHNPAPPSASKLPAIDVPLLTDPTFYTARQVDVHPRALADIKPAYPPLAEAQGITGWVLLQLKIDAAGTVQDLEVRAASPPGSFDQSALDAFRGARFAPAQKDGRAVNSLVEIKVRYELDP